MLGRKTQIAYSFKSNMENQTPHALYCLLERHSPQQVLLIHQRTLFCRCYGVCACNPWVHGGLSVQITEWESDPARRMLHAQGYTDSSRMCCCVSNPAYIANSVVYSAKWKQTNQKHVSSSQWGERLLSRGRRLPPQWCVLVDFR